MYVEKRHDHAHEVSDESLMTRYAAGDHEAFEELFARYEPRAYAFFLRRTASPDRVEDLYQTLFLRIHRSRGRFDPNRPFSAWFFQIANNLLVDEWRRVSRAQEVSLGDRDPLSLEAWSEECAARSERCEQVLGALSAEERYILVSSKVVGIGYSELAEHLGKSVDAVKKMASRAAGRVRTGALAGDAI